MIFFYKKVVFDSLRVQVAPEAITLHLGEINWSLHINL